MKKYLDLIPISAKIHRRQSRMTRICISLAVFLVTAMFGLADMYLQGEISKRIHGIGNWHYQIDSLEAEKAAIVSARPEVAISGWHSVFPLEAGYSIADQPVVLSGQEELIFEKVYVGTLKEGDYPKEINEILVSSEMSAKKLLSVGENIDLKCPDGSVNKYTITGFYDVNDTARLADESGPIIVLTQAGIDALASYSNGYQMSRQYVLQLSKFSNMQKTIANIIKQLGLSEDQVTNNGTVLSMLGQIKGNNASQIYGIAFGLSIIVMLTCILMISSSLNSNVIQRTEFFGMMRCLGASKKQIMKFVRHEGLHWCKTAIPVGTISAVFVVWIISAIMRTISPERLSYMPVLGISWISIVFGVMLGIITVLLAVRSPAKKAAKVSPLEAISGNANQCAAIRKAANTNLFKVETALGIYHAKASKKNFFLMTGAFAICIILFLAFSTVTDFMKNAMMPLPWTPELSIVSEDNTCSLENDQLAAIKQSNKVKRAYGRMFAYDIPVTIRNTLKNANLISYEKIQFSWAKDSLLTGTIESVMNEPNQVLLVNNNDIAVQVGDNITLSIDNNDHTVTVAGILSDSPLARDVGKETIICSEKTFSGLTGQSGYTIIDVQFNNNATEKNVDEVKSLFQDGTVFDDKLSKVQEQRRFYYAFSVLVYGFLSIIAAITVFHIMNTINMSVAAKMKLYGAMRAIGMSDSQLGKMIIIEAATYAISGSFFGCVLGIPLHMIIFVSLITTFWGISWTIPFAALGIIIGIILITTLISVRGPVKHIHNMSIVENISVQ